MIQQKIVPDKNLFFSGETVSFKLQLPNNCRQGKAVLRTNIGNGHIKFAEQIEKTELNRIPKGSEWHDLEMQQSAPGEFTITLPLTETGVFEAKCCFIPDNQAQVIWPHGDNFRIKVTSYANFDGNGIYCCFVRQWNKFMHLPHSPQMPDFTTLDQEGFTVVPPSGTFRQVIRKLDHIFDKLNCRILQLLPIHPTPMAYGRMGRYGSPFAATDYFSVDPALAEFDTSATPMEQFSELIDAVHARGGRIFMDLPVNHTGWASKLQSEHPDYFIRDERNHFVSPGAWGIVWADLCQLDYRQAKVHDLMAEVFLFWCKRHVDGFRCDAGYMLPVEAWEYIIAKVRREYPDTTFLLEGLGGPPEIQEKLLTKTGLDWGYSELFQNYTRDAINSYFPVMEGSGKSGGTLVNFAETHDNMRLAGSGKIYAKLRFMLNALLSDCGTFGFANGAEFFAEEKIDVHQAGALNFGAVDNLCSLVGQLNILLSDHPAFSPESEVDLIQHGPGNVIAALRHGSNIPSLLLLFNLDCDSPAEVHFKADLPGYGTEIFSRKKYDLQITGGNGKVYLAPGEALCISFDDYTIPETMPMRTLRKTKLMTSFMAHNAALNFVSITKAAAIDASMMCADPEKFVSAISGQIPAPVCHWFYPADAKRTVMAAPDDLLQIHSPVPFMVQVLKDDFSIASATSLQQDSGEFFAFIRMPRQKYHYDTELSILVTAFEPDGVRKVSGKIIRLADPSNRQIKLCCNWEEARDRLVFASNNSGSYAMFNAQWGQPASKYHALLAVNDNPEYPTDRFVMFSALRAWLIVDGYSRELNLKTLEKFAAHPGNRAKWEFNVPDGHGGKCILTAVFRMAEKSDFIQIDFHRMMRSDGITPQAKLILRCDLEDRSNHTVTKAYSGPEQIFKNSLSIHPDGFDFHPGKRNLQIRTSAGHFHSEPEWRYMADLPQERYYGMEDKTDLFSPGYFEIPLALDQSVSLTASIADKANDTPELPAVEFPDSENPEALAIDALKRFVVRRDDLSTVIAGYPWFTDWGRDTLIVLRGLVKFPEFQKKSAEIIRRFAAFEKSGTIPNMICGGNDSNRDTSDAPLYLILAVKDYIDATGDSGFLNRLCGKRKLKDILKSIIRHYISGTPNGIKMDETSGLIFSPSHFSWMDTNYPAGTPREGYPVEIQALWFAALDFTGEKKLAEKVRQSIIRYYLSGKVPCDCLHCKSGIPASQAVPDDHLRCNILTTITLGAVTDRDKQSWILNHASKLLIPGAIRTLDDAPVRYALPIGSNGTLLNDPLNPFQGYYRGPEDTSRKVAYHNGTAWSWPFPAFCEALFIAGGRKNRKRAISILYSAIDLIENGVVGQLPEVCDGNYPHSPGGCLAQAWSISEFYRVLKILKKE